MVSKCTGSSGCSGPRHSLHYSCGCEFRQLLLLVKGSSSFWHLGAQPLSYICHEHSLYSLGLPIRLKCKCREVDSDNGILEAMERFCSFSPLPSPLPKCTIQRCKALFTSLRAPWVNKQLVCCKTVAGLGCTHAKLLQLCPILSHPMDCSQPGPSVDGNLQARILKWVAMPFSRGSSQPKDRTCLLGLLHWQPGFVF